VRAVRHAVQPRRLHGLHEAAVAAVAVMPAVLQVQVGRQVLPVARQRAERLERLAGEPRGRRGAHHAKALRAQALLGGGVIQRQFEVDVHGRLLWRRA
jgi:hypothetical protein